MVDQLNGFASEVSRVAREVGTEGKLGGQAQVPGVAGVWKDLTDNVNSMASNLTNQVRNIAEVTTAVARGDLSRKITVDVKGEILELKNTINTMVDQLNAFASEVTRVAREVGSDGKLGGQAAVPGVAGTWKDLTDNVNAMASNLTGQVRNIADVATAIANGDLSRKITVDVKGEILELKNTINTMVDQLNAFASEVTRVAREVGSDGKLGGQAEVEGVAGVWKNLTDNVNSMASNLTGQVRNIAEVATAVARGDLSRKITVDVRGEILQLKNTINTMVDQLNGFASEVSRVAREVGTEGKLGGQAQVPGVAGVWKDLTDNVNSMASNLTGQVRNIAEVTTAVARGDLSRKITVDVKGEILELKNTINTMVDQLNGFASEVSRVAREVGTEGKLGGQAQVLGVGGVWKDLTDNVNSMASNLTNQVRNIADVTIAVAKGDLSRKITVDVRGEILQLKDTINTMVDQLNAFASEVSRVAREVGTEGKLGGQAQVPGVAGVWKDLTDNVNSMASNLTGQVRNIAEVTTAVARGDLSRKITVDVKGEILELKNTINTMVDQLRAFASEVTRVAREVGTEGKLGGQADVPGVAGTWKDLTDSVNVMGANLTNQVRGIVKVVTAVANGNLRQKLTVEAKGEVAALAETINNMTDTLATFAEQVTNVAREVGVEGRLGGQANVPGASGTWKDLTGNVNLLAANLTTQVRAIAEVATAVTKGDLTRSIQVDARGEVAELKDNINTMIDNLRATTDRNQEQDWLKTNLAKFTSMLQGQRDLVTVGKTLLSELSPLVEAQQGVIYQMERNEPGEVGETVEPRMLQLLAGYAQREDQPERITPGVGLVGQAAAEKQRILLNDVPPDYTRIHSSLGTAPPQSILVLPVLFEGETMAVIELAALRPFTNTHLAFLDQLTQSIGVVLNTIEATMRTENLLIQSQQLTTELQTRQIELQRTNEELASKAKQLAEQNEEVERKNKEVEQARRALEEKAAELALTSKYKSEFLANMSHELRTPLNSILILGQQLAENVGGNLTVKQTDFAKNIHSAGTDLLTLINDILDLSKIESGTVTVEPEQITFNSLRESVHRTFHHIAETKALGFNVEIDPALPRVLMSDSKRLQQILKNLLSNAFKFTAQGSVAMSVRHVTLRLVARPPGPLARRAWRLPSSSPTPGSGSRPRSSGSSSRRSSRPTPGPAASTAERAWGWPSAASWRTSSAARSVSPASRARGASSRSTCRSPTRGRRAVSRAAAATDGAGADPDALGRRSRRRASSTTARRSARGTRVLLVVEDDPHYARILLGIARGKGFKGIVAQRGQLALTPGARVSPHRHHARRLPARHAGVDGAEQPEARSRHPAHPGPDALRRGGAAARPLARRLLLPGEAGHHRRARGGHGPAQALSGARTPSACWSIEDNDRERASIVELLAHDDIEIESAGTGAEALARLRDRPFDCCVVDLRLPDMSGFELLERLQAEPALRDIPVVVFTGKELAGEEEARLRTVAKSIVLKDVQSPERLLDETALFLHRVIADLPEEKRRMIERLHGSTEVLRGRKVLVVDDDARNIFALTTVLENQEMEVLSATNGRQAIEIINATPDLSVVLMDIMMPEMDGYETMREIRKDPQVPHAPHPVAHRQGDEGRPREVPGGGRLRLHRQTCQHRPAAVAAPGLAVPLDAADVAPHRHIAGRRRGPKPRRAGGDPGEPQLSAPAGPGRRSGAAPAAGERRRGHRPRHQDAAGGRLRAGADDQEHPAVSRDAHRLSDRPPHRRSAHDRRATTRARSTT